MKGFPENYSVSSEDFKFACMNSARAHRALTLWRENKITEREAVDRIEAAVARFLSMRGRGGTVEG